MTMTDPATALEVERRTRVFTGAGGGLSAMLLPDVPIGIDVVDRAVSTLRDAEAARAEAGRVVRQLEEGRKSVVADDQRARAVASLDGTPVPKSTLPAYDAKLAAARDERQVATFRVEEAAARCAAVLSAQVTTIVDLGVERRHDAGARIRELVAELRDAFDDYAGGVALATWADGIREGRSRYRAAPLRTSYMAPNGHPAVHSELLAALDSLIAGPFEAHPEGLRR